ncbi:MAG TPA: class I SAM-dependent methyltransferase [Gammaproteobacteria bacterium]
MNTTRRDVLKAAALALGCAPLRGVHAQTRGNGTTGGNFSYIYADHTSASEFKKFLVNVFHLYPEDDLHRLIEAAVADGSSDEEVYRVVQGQLDDIKPFLGDLTYSLPTLSKQKDVLADQTVQLVGKERRIEGYLEVGSNGRFLDSLEERLDIVGDSFTVSDRAPTYSIIDVLDRGQLFKSGSFVALADYRPQIAAQIPRASIDLATVFIGFHHCPIELREEFIGGIRDVLRPGGALVVRDHHAHDERMWRMVALAHDVFNMGTNETWDYNERERRNFYPLETLHELLTRSGFRSDGRRLLQDGDPTLNTLMLYTKA